MAARATKGTIEVMAMMMKREALEEKNKGITDEEYRLGGAHRPGGKRNLAMAHQRKKKQWGTKATRTGGKYETFVFVHMFDAALERLAQKWHLMGYSFNLQGTGECIANANWVDNTFILAPSVHEWHHMTATMTAVLTDEY